MMNGYLKELIKNNNMTSRDFVYWLQGFFEIENPESITPEQTKMIKNHLNLVFDKKTESIDVQDNKKGSSGQSNELGFHGTCGVSGHLNPTSKILLDLEKSAVLC